MDETRTGGAGMDKPVVRLGLIGAGTFVRKAHVPSLLNLQDSIQVVAVCSRTRASAEAVAAMLPGEPDVYTDIAEVLARPDIDAVDVALPIPMMPDVVEQALAQGKHVISEKPIAPTVERARRMISFHAQTPGPVWLVAENFRYIESFRVAGELIKAGEIGRPLLMNWRLELPVLAGSPYHKTDWRRSGTYPGGFLVDGGVHHAAAMRLVLGEVREVSALVAAFRADLPPADTMAALLRFGNGAIGSYVVTYAAGSPRAMMDMEIVGESGSMRVGSERLEIRRDDESLIRRFRADSTVQSELAAFAAAIREGANHYSQPVEALNDLAVVAAMLKAHDSGGSVQVEVEEHGAAQASA